MYRLSKILAHSSGVDSPDGLCFIHYCDGCDSLHRINVSKPNQQGAKWSWNNNPEMPTFSPSINIVGRCHYFIIDGKIKYCEDSKHALAGKTVELPNLPDWCLSNTGSDKDDDSA